MDDRCEIILDYCDTRLDEVEGDSSASTQLQEIIQTAREAVQALRLGLKAPAQSAAANLIDQLLRNASAAVYGDKYTHMKTFNRVQTLSERASAAGLSFFTSLGVLCELATMMPVLSAMTPWFPDSGTPPPTTFSRHVITHFITAPGQVTRTNALIAVMTAISLLSQQHDSRWNTWRVLNFLEAGELPSGSTGCAPALNA